MTLDSAFIRSEPLTPSQKEVDDFVYAAGAGSGYVVMVFLEKYGADSVDKKSSQGETALFRAAAYAQPGTVALLLKNGADPEVKDKEERTILMHASHERVVDLLLKNGADCNHQDREGTTPLMQAAAHSTAGAVALLLEKGADINKKDHQGKTALMWAAQWGCVEQVEFLLEKGAHLDDRDDDGRTAFVWATRPVLGHGEEIRALLHRWPAMQAVKARMEKLQQHRPAAKNIFKRQR